MERNRFLLSKAQLLNAVTIKNKWLRWALVQILVILCVGSLLLFLYLYQLDKKVQHQFEGKRWQIPSRMFARPLELYEGKQLDYKTLITELDLLRYKKSRKPKLGSYYRKRNSVYIRTRAFDFWDSSSPAIFLEVKFSGKQIHSLWNVNTGEQLDLWRLEPLFIGAFYPKIKEDRILVRLQDVPQGLIETLLVVEDRNFYQHHGIAPLSILRALFANIRAGAKRQGGSTLTQQLVKNFFLTNEKTITRKINEAFMSLLLEWRFSKDEILEAYLNEIYLGQDGSRGIHGFGLAAQFYFDAPLKSLNAGQIALLVGLVKGASYYDPRRFPERAKKRRHVVLSVQKKLELIDAEIADYLDNSPLGVTKNKPSGVTRYPAFVDLVKQQLKQDYRAEDLAAAGLRLFTTIDPVVQTEAENSIRKRLPRYEKLKRLKKNSLQAAVIVTDNGSGAVRAIVGGRNFRAHGYNRALNTKRNIGSLIKPAVYLAALREPRKYSLNTNVEDSPIEIMQENGQLWSPRNYDKKFHGDVSLISALANSYNLAAVRVGMDLGLEKIVDTVHDLGINRKIQLYPSMLLGAVEMSVYEVLQMYQTLSDNGFQSPIRAIHTVTTDSGEILNKYPIKVKQTIPAESVYLLITALKEVSKHGTARSLKRRLPKKMVVAGKTGTTNDYRDSWFAGLTGDKVAVVWVGSDDNRSTRLTGGSGALPIWADIISKTAKKSVDVPVPERISFARVYANLHRSKKRLCGTNLVLPFVSGHMPARVPVQGCLDEK